MYSRSTSITISIALVSIALFVSNANSEEVQFDRDVRPILSDKCFFCHGPDNEHREADLRLDLEENVRDYIDADDPMDSDLILRVLSDDPDEVMPPASAHKELTDKEKETLTEWIKQGANWSQHWAFVPQPADVPLKDEGQPTSIDGFISEKLATLGKGLNPEASREKLIRRVTYDLTGLPPTLEEVDAFLADKSSNAYEKVVDRLLASPRYGQRMAIAWLDVARYGDTSVYHADGPREMWAWRDAIVDAYNQNMPFDEFSINQLAGDLLPDATHTQRLLSGFNRNNGTTDEGGAIAEEYRVEYAVDRVKTTSMAWLGLTMECAQCHDHKYDPISQEEYYQFYAFFNVSSDKGMQTRKGNAEPKLDVFDPEKQTQIPETEKKLAAIKDQLKRIETDSDSEFQVWLKDQNNVESDTPAGLIADLPILAGKEDQLKDLVDAERKYKLHGKYKWVDSKSDQGIEFKGEGYADLGNVGDFERSDQFSYGGWYRPNQKGRGALVAKMDNHNGFRGYDVLVGMNDTIEVHLVNRWPTNAIKVSTKKKLSAKEYHHIMVTYDGSSKAEGIKIYVNGEIWKWNIVEDRLSDSIKTEKTLLVGSRHPDSRLRGIVNSVQVYNRKLDQAEIKALAKSQSISTLLSIKPDERTEQQLVAIKQYYLNTENKAFKQASRELSKANSELAELKKPLTSVMVMMDQPKPRETFVLDRGAYDSPTKKKVEAGIPAVLPPMSEELPKNRLGMAKWLFQDDNPLTARVTVNRYWQMFFGRGLVATPEDFGSQGEFPSHPELLDWLAADFRSSGWDTKRFIKQLLMSQTYRQSSMAPRDEYLDDPDNRWVGRGPRFRLQGEFIRDTALELSGLLVDTYGGPGVKPYQPAGLWKEVGLSGKPAFVQDKGEKLYRRSLYTYWKRSAPPPTMQIFDAPTREKCSIRRARTNTPLQALVTLNDIQFVEASRHFAERILSDGGSTESERMTFAFRLATSRLPTDEEQQVLSEILQTATKKYSANDEAAKQLLSIGESKRNEALNLSEHAAWTVVASSILNLDETLTRE